MTDLLSVNDDKKPIYLIDLINELPSPITSFLGKDGLQIQQELRAEWEERELRFQKLRDEYQNTNAER